MGFPDNFWRNLGWVVSILRFDCHKWNSYYTNHHFFLARYWSLAKTGFGIRCPPCLQNRQVLVAAPSIRLLKHVVRCYLRLCDNAHAKEVLKPHGYGAAWGFMGFHGACTADPNPTLMWLSPALTRCHHFSRFAFFGAWHSWENVTCSFHHGCPHGSCASSPGLNPFQLFVCVKKMKQIMGKPTHFPANIKDAGLAPDHSLETNTTQTVRKKNKKHPLSGSACQTVCNRIHLCSACPRTSWELWRKIMQRSDGWSHCHPAWLAVDLRWFCSIPSDISLLCDQTRTSLPGLPHDIS